MYIDKIIYHGEVNRNSFLNHIPAVKYLSEHRELSFPSNVTFFVGENGTGKSTLLEAIAVAYGFNAEGGSKNFNFATSTTHSELHDHITIANSRYAKDGYFLRAESFYNVATNIDLMDSEPSFGTSIINSYGGISLHKQSHGESFLALVQNRFGGNGLYILDEPEAALSPSRLMTLLVEIQDLVKHDSQFIIATHSPILMSFPKSQIYELSERGIASVQYKETENYRITRQFLENPEQMLKYLLEE